MSQNTLIEKIKNDAASAVEEIKTQGVAEIESIKQATETEIAELRKAHEASLEKKKAQLELVAVSKAKQAGNIAVQTAKREQIDAIFAAVTTELADQGTDEYVSFFSAFVADIVPKEVEVTVVQAPKNRVEETEKILKTVGLTGTVESGAGITAGLVITAKDGVYDITLERLITERRAELEMIIVNQAGA